MLTQIESPRKDTLVYELDGYVSEEDIVHIDNGIEFTLSLYDRVNLMIYLNAKGEGLSTLIREFKLGTKYSNCIYKIAFVSDKKFSNLFMILDNFTNRYQKKYFECR